MCNRTLLDLASQFYSENTKVIRQQDTLSPAPLSGLLIKHLIRRTVAKLHCHG